MYMYEFYMYAYISLDLLRLKKILDPPLPGTASSPSGVGAQGAGEATTQGAEEMIAGERVSMSAAAAAAELGQARRLASPPSATSGSLPGRGAEEKKKREKREEEKWPHIFYLISLTCGSHIFFYFFLLTRMPRQRN